MLLLVLVLVPNIDYLCLVKQMNANQVLGGRNKLVGVCMSWVSSGSFAFLCRQNKLKPEPTAEAVQSSGIMVSNKTSIASEPKFGLRDTIIKSQLVQMEDSYTHIQNFR